MCTFVALSVAVISVGGMRAGYLCCEGREDGGGGGVGGGLVTDSSHDTEDKQTNNKDNPVEYNKDHYTVHYKDI